MKELDELLNKLKDNDKFCDKCGHKMINEEVNNSNTTQQPKKSHTLAIVLSIIGGILGGITTFIIAIVFSIYILTDKENIGEALRQTLYAYMKKENVEKILNVGNVSSNTFKNFLMRKD